jgi:hypothetical protein
MYIGTAKFRIKTFVVNQTSGMLALCVRKKDQKKGKKKSKRKPGLCHLVNQNLIGHKMQQNHAATKEPGMIRRTEEYKQ